MPASDVLTAADVDELRALVEDLAMPDVFRLVRDTRTYDDAGGSTVVTTTVASGPCRLRTSGVAGSGSAIERQIADQRGWVGFYVVDLHPDVTVLASDRLVINGRTFEVGGVVAGGVWSMTTTVVVQEVGT